MSEKIQDSSSADALESRLDQALQLIPTIEFDAGGKALAANEAMLKYLGYGMAELGELQLSDVVSEDKPDDLWRSKGSTAEPIHLVTSNGDLVPVFAICERRGRGKSSTRTLVATPAPEGHGASPEGDQSGWIDAISRSQAVIEFDMKGVILRANDNFCAATGYTEEELVGQHHRIFCTKEYASSNDYKNFWASLNRGDFVESEFERRTKSGDPLWIQASYNPVFDGKGKAVSVVKFATDITDSVNAKARTAGMMAAISKSQAVIQFDMDGIVTAANENVCDATGYREADIIGKHHRIFCTEEHASSAEYEEFWKALNRGEFKEGEFERRSRSGDVLWLQATYNPIFDPSGAPMGVVKFAADITSQVDERAARLREQQEQTDWLNAEVGKVLDVVSRAGEGDLDVQVDTDAEGPVGELAEGVNKMLLDLRNMVESDRARSAALSAEVTKILEVVSSAGTGI